MSVAPESGAVWLRAARMTKVCDKLREQVEHFVAQVAAPLIGLELPRLLSLTRSVLRVDELACEPQYCLVKVREVLQRLQEEGWVLRRQRGSHRQFFHPA